MQKEETEALVRKMELAIVGDVIASDRVHVQLHHAASGGKAAIQRAFEGSDDVRPMREADRNERE